MKIVTILVQSSPISHFGPSNWNISQTKIVAPNEFRRLAKASTNEIHVSKSRSGDVQQSPPESKRLMNEPEYFSISSSPEVSTSLGSSGADCVHKASGLIIKEDKIATAGAHHGRESEEWAPALEKEET
jgi:hypothetical protein